MGVAVAGRSLRDLWKQRTRLFGASPTDTPTSRILTPIKLDRQGRFHLGKKAYQSQHISPTVYARSSLSLRPNLLATLPHYSAWADPADPIAQRAHTAFAMERPLPDHPPLHRPFSTAQSRKDARDVNRIFQHVQTPCFNLVFADTKGQIGYRQVGLLPRRLAGQRSLINPEDPREFWQDFLKPHEVPLLLQPKRGFIVTANNRTFPQLSLLYGRFLYPRLSRQAHRNPLTSPPKTHARNIPSHPKRHLRPRRPDPSRLDAWAALHLALGKDLPDPLTSEAIRILQRWDHPR